MLSPETTTPTVRNGLLQPLPAPLVRQSGDRRRRFGVVSGGFEPATPMLATCCSAKSFLPAQTSRRLLDQGSIPVDNPAARRTHGRGFLTTQRHDGAMGRRAADARPGLTRDDSEIEDGAATGDPRGRFPSRWRFDDPLETENDDRQAEITVFGEMEDETSNHRLPNANERAALLAAGPPRR